MTTRECSIEGCGRSHDARGWCTMHYRRWKRNGDPLTRVVNRGDPAGSLSSHSERQGECLVWTGAMSRDGYGISKAGGKSMGAHRLSYLVHRGEIPPECRWTISAITAPASNPPTYVWLQPTKTSGTGARKAPRRVTATCTKPRTAGTTSRSGTREKRSASGLTPTCPMPHLPHSGVGLSCLVSSQGWVDLQHLPADPRGSIRRHAMRRMRERPSRSPGKRGGGSS